MLLALLAMRAIGLTSNIMSLGGIAIAIGAMIDAAIVMIENAHKHVEHEQAKPESERRDRKEVIIAAAKEVGPSLFFSLLIITVGFLPVFALQDQEGRLFKPLAYTKTFSMLFAALLSITVAPFLMTVLIRGKIPPEEKNPLNKLLIWVYRPFARLALRLRYFMVLLAAVAIGLIVPIYRSLGSEFMPPLWEGTLLYMPVTLPGASIETMREAIEDQDRILMTFPEVLSVFAKAGRAETATDPAPLEMVETVINLKAARAVASGDDSRPADRRDGRRAEAEAGRVQHELDDADQGPHRHALDRHPHPDRDQDFWARPAGDRPPRPRGGAGCQHGSRHPQRLRRASVGRLLPRLRRTVREHRPLRPDGRRRAGGHPVGRGRRQRDHHHRGPRAVPGQRPLRP